MRILADPKARTEVRAEAAQALGIMQITRPCPTSISRLVAYAASSLPPSSVTRSSPVTPRRARLSTQTKAEYLTSHPGRPALPGVRGPAGRT